MLTSCYRLRAAWSSRPTRGRKRSQRQVSLRLPQEMRTWNIGIAQNTTWKNYRCVLPPKTNKERMKILFSIKKHMLVVVLIIKLAMAVLIMSPRHQGQGQSWWLQCCRLWWCRSWWCRSWWCRSRWWWTRGNLRELDLLLVDMLKPGVTGGLDGKPSNLNKDNPQMS